MFVLQEAGVPTRQLKKVTIPMVDRAVCKKNYGNANMPITDR